MEFDSQSQCSDEGVELSLSEHGLNFPNEFIFSDENQPDFVEAKVVYLLLPRNVPVSRAARVQWLLDHLNKIVSPSNCKSFDASQNIEVLSAVGREQNSNLKCNRFLITYRTELKFMAHSYRFVYCFDMSPSHANVDTDGKEFLFDQILHVFRTTIEALSKQFTIPGNTIIFQPTIYLTIMVNTPFFVSPAQQVILKGVKLMSQNIKEIIKCVELHFDMLEEKIAEVCIQALDKLDNQKISSRETNGGFEQVNIGKPSKVPMVTADANFVNMLRYSMLAISLLPEITLSHILVITDGIVAMPDSNVMETLLHQLHYDAVAVSFLKVGSSYQPHSAAGLVSYFDLLDFFAHSTLGTCLESFPKIVHDPSFLLNFYQDFFLIWSFHNRNYIKDSFIRSCDISSCRTLTNDKYYNQRLPTLLSKRQTEDSTGASITLLLARRMREGFIIDDVFYMNGNLMINLIHQWKSSIFIHYKLKCLWPATKNVTYFEISVYAPYDFLHDMTCMIKKETKSVFRQAIIQRFWSRLSQISSGDLNLAVQLSNLTNNKDWYTLPESVRSGIAVFSSNNTMSSDTTKLNLTPRDLSCLKFINIWQDISQMETNHWRKWFHTYRISLVLTHDNPLPSTLYMSSSSQRYQVVQCREAVTALYGMLSKWASFMLIENHTYLKLIYKEHECVPIGFCIVRVSSKFPSAVLNLGFSTDMPGQIRLQTFEALKSELTSLSYIPKAKGLSCCVLLHKPLEKILIRYEKVPNSYTTVVFPDGTQPPDNSSCFSSSVSGSLFTTLSRYLFHKRWIWRANYAPNPKLPDLSTSRILNALTSMRLEEGFHFAYSSSGIVTMVLEVMLEPNTSCVVQYVLFPPHYNWGDDYYSGSEDDTEPISDMDAELQLVTEVWIEPQYGTVLPRNSRINYINGKNYYEIADAINQVDYGCINVLLTMEHMSLMCVNKAVHNLSAGPEMVTSKKRTASQKSSSRIPIFDSQSHSVPEIGSAWYPIITPRIEHIPFKFDPVGILHLCQQTELIYSMLIEDRCKNSTENKVDKANKLLLDNIFEHFSLLHDRDLELTKENSENFTKEIISRHHERLSCRNCPISEINPDLISSLNWKCYIKGVSLTHVIITFLPASIEDVKSLTGICSNKISDNIEERASSRTSNISDVPIYTPNSLCLPVYVYDCPIKLLINSFIDNERTRRPASDDFFEDHRFVSGVQEECFREKENNSESSDDTDHTDNKKFQEHCKALTFTHSKCFTLSLFLALHLDIYICNSDIQSAMDMCEEELIQIDILDFIKNICSHVKQNKDDKLSVQMLREAHPCRDITNYHMLIKRKFFSILCSSFHRVPSNGEYYYYKYLSIKPEEPVNDSDDEASVYASDIEFRGEREMSIYSEDPHLLSRDVEVGLSEIAKLSDVSPLFLHLTCTVKYNGGHANTSVRVLPTCLGELIQKLNSEEFIDKPQLQITLDILCLTLPPSVQNILTEYSQQDDRNTSFCSDGFQRSLSSVSDSSAISDFQVQHKALTEAQRQSVDRLCEEIKWLLEDEICTTLLDANHVTMDMLNYVIKHVSEGHPSKPSCRINKIVLNFVFTNDKCHEKFLEEFSKMPLPLGYKLCQEEEYYYVAKNEILRDIMEMSPKSYFVGHSESNDYGMCMQELFKSTSSLRVNSYREDTMSQQSEISSDGMSGTEAGYDEDVSDNDEDWEWLNNLNDKKPLLSNFWMILKVDQDLVHSYFHCRFLEATAHVRNYKMVESGVRDSIVDLCKKVNQLLLLQALYETKKCDPLLEPDDVSINDNLISKSISKLRQADLDASDDSEVNLISHSVSEASINFKPGFFSCPVVWEKVFVLHPRLKTGSGGKVRGILALRHILEKFSVQNRSNMFVHKDKDKNVFYLSLYESSHINSSRLSVKPNDNDSTTFSRSPSIASLPIGHNNAPNLAISEQSLPSISSSDLRPRVRSFGEKESRSFETKERVNEDTLVLKVHGITNAGTELQCDLVQVLQNRLDDAVLESLSVMLARNAMCPLTPEDVRFIQKPLEGPDHIIRLNIQDFILRWGKSNSFMLYLKQNLLQFLNIPKYTDTRPEYHFKDYSENDNSNGLGFDNIFIYNQSQTPAAGSRGIACIVLVLIQSSNTPQSSDVEQELENIFITKDYKQYVSSGILKDDICPSSYLEFRLWKQGRINLDNFSKSLKLAVSHATWDIITEYYLLKQPLCVKEYSENPYKVKKKCEIDNLDLDLDNEIEYDCELGLNYNKNIKDKAIKLLPKKVDAHFFPTRKYNKRVHSSNNLKASRAISCDDKENISEQNDNGILSLIYSKFLPSWLEFGHTMTTPAVKKNDIKLVNRHLPSVIVKELIVMLNDSPKAFRAVTTSCLSSNSDKIYVPFVSSNVIQKYIIISRNFQKWQNIDDGFTDVPDALNPQNLKHSQKFVPGIINNCLIPRRKIFWICVDNEHISIYTYNWAKDNVDKLVNHCENLASWLSVRSCYLNSVTLQKLGLFHNQPLTRKCFMLSTNNYKDFIGNLDGISKFPRDHSHRRNHQSSFNLPVILEAFRDNFYNTKYTCSDIAVVFTIEMKEMRSLERKHRDEMKKLHSMYQSRTGTTSVPQLNLLMQNSRILHYVHTPLLFLPRWRLKSASTRDHSLYPSQAIQIADKIMDKEKESWHTELCYTFFSDYRNYLHSLGFTPLQIDNSQSTVGAWTRDKSSHNSVFYIQRTILGGILIFTVSFEEPFFVVKLHAIECNRLQNITFRASVNAFTLTFLDECDKVKILMHLHSFTYDYHMRCIYNYISGNTVKLTEKYNVHQFLDDFLKYYNKAPNFARNLVHTDTLTIGNLVTEGKQLYDYLLSNVHQYGFKVLEMDDGCLEYILVQVTTAKHVSYKDSQDRQHTDDFDMTLVVYNLCTPFKPTDNVLHLRYYLILTSKRDTYPMFENEQKLGKFRTVSFTASLEADSKSNTSKLESSGEGTDPDRSKESIEEGSLSRSSEDPPLSKRLANVRIRQESVNYLGYYSSHEQSMQQLILDKAKSTQNDIKDMVSRGMEHCRTNLLWNRLISPQESNHLTFEEFIELKQLSKLKPLYDLHPNLRQLLIKPFQWYQGLTKLLLAKYEHHHRIFSSADGNVVYYIILHPRYYGAFMMLSLDSHTVRGELHAVYREPHKQADVDPLGLGYEKSLRDGFVRCICFYLWSGMICN
ncbi:LOW QUALITY PROTEIN: KICSTOR complex protein SZT2-like [Sitophilus oryzae]|uniref:LOW QUALITY PROTEIN: KICSTOR complex protein SZT2-like n=1 Tax=Sitophilus oryzae TaxID=7048 RepID=A0A6J2XB11_SITOR|nr:LOW QUALITY PROTEIN: KICSTOR complex protein SZT2-like [Sitophilus oryzae]